MLKSGLAWLWGVEGDTTWRGILAGSPVTSAILVITVSVSVADMLLPAAFSGIGRLSAVLGWAPARVANGEWWRLVASTLTNSRVTEGGFLVSAPGHLLGNMLGLALAGPRLERVIGHLRLLVIYLVATVVANAAAMATLPWYWTANGGSSRSVYTLFGGVIVAAFLARRSSDQQRNYLIFAVLTTALVDEVAVAIGAIAQHVQTAELHVTHGTAFVVGVVLVGVWLRGRQGAGVVLASGLLVASFGLVGALDATGPKPDSNVVHFVETASRPTLVTFAFGSIWTTSLNDGTVTRIDPSTARIVKTLHVAESPGPLVATDRYVWVSANRRDGLYAIDPGTNRVVSHVRLPEDSWGVAATPGALWVALSLKNEVIRIDDATHRVVKTIKVANEPLMLTARGSSVWVTSAKGMTVSRIDALSNTVAAAVRVGPDEPYNMLLEGKSLWVVGGKGIARMDWQSLKTLELIPSKEWVFDIARSRRGALWATHQYVYELSRVDVGGRRLSRGIKLGFGRSFGIASDDRGDLWLADGFRQGVLEIIPAR